MNFFGKTNPDTLDATHASLSQAVRSGDAAALAQALSGVKPAAVNHVPVSYTHLTLPTICSV